MEEIITVDFDPLGNWEEELNKIGDDPSPENYEFLKNIYRAEGFDIFSKYSFPKYASRFFLYYQNQGIDDLTNFFLIDDIKQRYRIAILKTLYFTSKKQYLEPDLMVERKLFTKNPPISDEMAAYAHQKLFDLISISFENSKIFDSIISFLYEQTFMINDEVSEIKREIFSLLRDSTLRINGRIISDFQNLVNNDETEEEAYQKFLTNHPVLIDPLAKEIIPKQKLGSEYIPDFVIKKLNNEYILIEIEKSKDKIFNRKNDFSKQFIHAVGQVIDFQEWVESHIEYAQTNMPDIKSPVGIVVIGRNKDMDERQKTKLNRFIINMNNRLKIYTYDDILENAKKLLNNIMKNQ